LCQWRFDLLDFVSHVNKGQQPIAWAISTSGITDAKWAGGAKVISEISTLLVSDLEVLRLPTVPG